MPVYILGIESSCDETSASVTADGIILSNIVAGQDVHAQYGGVVPELASRAHQQQIIPVVDAALREAGISPSELHGIAFTRGPGLIGSLLVGCSFAKGMSLALKIPLIEVNHMQAHVIANFAFRTDDVKIQPEFPFLCLTVSGGHTQLVVVNSYTEMEVIGETRDDAAGEAFDKVAKMLNLPYPGGPFIDKFAAAGNPLAYKFPHPFAPDLDFSFSGLKTAVLYFLQKERDRQPDFPGDKMADVCASVQHTIIEILLEKLKTAMRERGMREIALAGGVSANSGLRKRLTEEGQKNNWKVHIPPFEYCTDNAGMISVYGYYKFMKGDFCQNNVMPLARMPF
ncbi:MAG: tRNA (adenosine(37)-N6)-threonylcarbamoyltransferase complex transferase subunit TsaD [Bacteroidia bacterium]